MSELIIIMVIRSPIVMPPKRQRKFRNICWTLYAQPNIHTAIDVSDTVRTVVEYYVYQPELCPNTGQRHWQGYMELKDQLTLSTIKSKIFEDDTVHIEERRGTAEQAAEYCMDIAKREPGADVVEWGRRKHQGQRKDLFDFIDASKEGQSLSSLRQGMPHVASRAMQWCNAVHADIRREQIPELRFLFVAVLYGGAGSGKTRAAHAMYGESMFTITPSMEHKNWWCGYDMEEALLIDDFDGISFEFRFLLRLLDIYRLQLPTKGGHTWAAWTHVVITSQYHPDRWYPAVNDAASRNALMRRIHHIVEML